MRADVVLQRLDKVRKTGHGKWLACCPAHDDKNPSLSIGEGSDGRVLLYCHAGCNTGDVLDAVGLTFEDVMPERLSGHRHKPLKPAFDARQVLAAVQHEIYVAAIIADRIAGIAEIAEERDRLLVTAGRLSNALDLSSSVGVSAELKRIRRGES